MTYPSPYQPPTGYYGYAPQPPDLAQPARRAGLLMIVIGILGALVAGCGGVMGTLVQQDPQSAQMIQQLEAQSHTSFATQIKVVVFLFSIPGFVMIVLGMLVRRGRNGPIIASLIVVGLLTALLTLQLVGSLYMTAQGNPQGLMAAFMCLVIIAPHALLLYWLFKAINSVGPLKAFNAQHQAYQWQMAEQARSQQQYYQNLQHQQGGNYPPPPPPPPPPAG